MTQIIKKLHKVASRNKKLSAIFENNKVFYEIKLVINKILSIFYTKYKPKVLTKQSFQDIKTEKRFLSNMNKLVASDGSDYDYYGYSVAVSNTKIVIGVPYDRGFGSGRVYIYDLDGSNEIKLLASDTSSGTMFGHSVAVSDTKIVIGVYGDDKGCAYVYDLDGTNEIKITASDGVDYDRFGHSVAISDTKIVIGAYGKDDKGSYAGCVYVYDLDGTNEIKLTASDASSSARFGHSVAISDTKIVIGAPGKDDKGSYTGCVYVYDLDGSNEIKLAASDGADYDYFGHSVAISDTKIVIGAYGDDDKGCNSGSVYLYDLDGSNEIKLTPSDGAGNNYFGYSVDASGTKIVVGAYGDRNKGWNSGCVYIYDLDKISEIKLTPSDGVIDNYFGHSVAVSSTKIMIGAYGNGDNGYYSGCAYIYE